MQTTAPEAPRHQQIYASKVIYTLLNLFFDNNFYLYSGELVEFLEKLQDAEVKEGNSFQLSILVSAAAKSVAWQKDGQAIVTGEEGGFEVRNNAYNC